jgi:C-terminal processing protease CtpA/Prc
VSVFVFSVLKNSPAAEAGMKPGDRLIAVDGTLVTTPQDAGQRMRSPKADPVTLQLKRRNRSYSVTIQPMEFTAILRKNGQKMLRDGTIVSFDVTEAEAQYLEGISQAVEGARDLSVAFPDHHYPLNKQLYYPGFEVFVWGDRENATVGGIEDGPASRAGVRWGDQIVAIDGTNAHKKSVTELEALLSSLTERSMTLTIERANVRKTFSFELARAATVLRRNQWQVINGKLVPVWVPEKYLSCFLRGGKE